jgi:ribosomal protein S17E
MTSVNDLTIKQVAEIKARILAGEFQHKLASEFELNQGRINEIAKGKRFAFVPPAKIKGGKVAMAPRP